MAATVGAMLLLVARLSAADDQPPINQTALMLTEIAPPVQGIEALFSVGPMAAAEPMQGDVPTRDDWTVSCDSQGIFNRCDKVLDGDNSTYWQSTSGWPQTMTVNMQNSNWVSGISMLPQNSTSGNIAVHELYVSLDGQNWGDPIAYGTWWGDATAKTAVVEPVQAQYVRLVSYSAALGEDYLKMAEFFIFTIDGYVPQTFDPSKGRWGPTIDFPIVPVGAWIDPPSGRFVAFSSYQHDQFDNRGGKPSELLGRTLTSTWDPVSKQVSQRIVNETGHDMFCPGMSLDFNGRMVISGGQTNLRTTIYTDDSWVRFADMNDPRGYQSSATVSDGRIFTIGGSWDAVDKTCQAKDGEIYDPTQNTWTRLPGCPVKPMWTAETSDYMTCPTFRRDNHAWLFPWKMNTVFQAGPSKAMNWYTAKGSGGIFAAGNRLDDKDAMCGSAVMYDANAGKILAVGGAATYVQTPARNAAFLMTLKDVNKTVPVTRAAPMTYRRTFHNSMILPNGDTLVTGGRLDGRLFMDGDNSILTPEIYSVARNTWTALANYSIPRTYHSVGILLPDATILIGGGGLCGPCAFNHFDAQIFTPPYLLSSTGDLATRPVIVSTTSATVPLGGNLRFSTDSQITNASLIRYGSVTHSLNTDQRRIPLNLAPLSSNNYASAIPSDPGVVVPGYWMLFVLNAAGVPSKATTIQILPK